MRLCRSFIRLVFLASFLVSGHPWADAQQLSAIYLHGTLSVTIPYQGAHLGAGTLTTTMLDPEDHVLAQTQCAVTLNEPAGDWQQVLTPQKPITVLDLPWQRLRYRFHYADGQAADIQGLASISQILRRPVVRVLGQSEYLSGSHAAIRVIVTDKDAPTAGSVRVDLLVHDKPAHTLFSGRLNSRGSVDAQFHLPAGLDGSYELHFVAETPAGSAEYTQPVHLLEKASILLTTEKPLYQPGQTIHVRALALDRASHAATADRPLTFELEDSRGNKVFKKVTATDRFGIASAEFSLADEVNLGTYHLRALMATAADPDASGNRAEVALNVERYVLPKFKVMLDFSNVNGKPRRDYRPGDHVTGTLHANYFFGEPVSHADVSLTASSADVTVFEAASAKGTTDKDGVFHFDLQLPNYFAGKPLSQGAARALVEASVKDSAAHTETRGEPITISQSALLLNAVPEGGTLVPNLENQIFLLASYPDGTPAASTLTVRIPHAQDQHVTTDATGVAVIRIHATEGTQTLSLDADDHHGNRATASIPLDTRGGQDQILLHTSRAIFKPGDRIQLHVVSTRRSGSAYIDIIKSGQTLLTRDLDLQNGEADLTLTATPEMTGTLDLDAYLIGRDAQPVADHRLVFVQPADELKIESSTDAGVYRPGGEARVRFHVTNARGEGVSAALGLQIVDEAVFALAEKQPGFAKVFFYLEQEVMKPRYEIHSVEMPSIIGAAPSADNELAARALFSATEIANPARVDVEFGRTLPQEHAEEFRDRYQQAFVAYVQKLANQLRESIRSRPTPQDFVADFNQLTLTDSTRDAWGTRLRIDPVGWPHGPGHIFLVRSAGPDKVFDTSDDLNVYLRESSTKAHPRDHVSSEFAPNGSTIDVAVDHDRGPDNGRAQITGTALDWSGADIPGATVTLRDLASAATRTTHTDAAGRFNFSALPAGRYKVHIGCPGFTSVSRQLTLEARDLATMTSTLAVGSVSETVSVEAVATNGVELELLDAAAMRPVPAPMARGGVAFAQDQWSGRFDMKKEKATYALATGNAAVKSANNAPHIRSWFPEALYINPEILTDGRGDASITIPIADSITTWRMAMLASTQSGALGSATGSLKVFQDFFVDLDLPVTLTQGDRVTIPIGIYNYSGAAGHVALTLTPEPWYTLEDQAPDQTIDVDSGKVGAAHFTLNAQRIGKFKLTLTAHMNGDGKDAGRDDIIVREIEVVPNGREQNVVFNGRLEHTIDHTLTFPANAIPDASSVLVRLYPGPLSQVIEGMDSILRMPSGCFEQTSSSTYPNVLALDYMKRTKKLTPEVHAKAEGYIVSGYQRLLTFEVAGGGFSWFGQAPANKILTSYGLMEFNDMAKVSEVDPRLIERTRNWLAAQQQPDGSWKPDTNFINEGATNRYNSDVLRITAYVAWALANTGYQGPAVEKAKRYIEAHISGKVDTYTLAVIANFAVDLKDDPEFTRRSMQALLDARTEKDDLVSWTTDETSVYATGPSAAVETTGLATQALLKWGQANETVHKALNYITSKKDSSGNWGTTQATIMALRALLLASESNGSDTRGTVRVLLNGKPVQTLELNADNSDLFQQFVFRQIDPTVPNTIQLAFEGKGGLAYQVVGRFFTPWEPRPTVEPLSIDVAYDRTTLARNDIATATATIHNNLQGTAKMIMVDLGIPPGFDLLSEDLQALQDKAAEGHMGHLEKFSLTATQAILYFDALAANQTVSFKVRLRAKYPIRAQTFQSRVYEYYAPEVNAVAHPVQLQVNEH